MKGWITLCIILVLLPVVSAAESCDAFCLDASYDYGECRETTEDEGFCDGIEDEDVFGFSSCENLERCCCGFDEESAEEATAAEEEGLEEGAVVENSECTELVVPVEEAVFWVLLIAVIVLGIAAFTLSRKKVEDIIEEL